MDPSVRKLVAEIVGLKKQVRAISSGPQLAYSSIESGSIDEYNADGSLVGIFGQQPDGTHTATSLNGPTPPEPSTPAVAARVGGVTVSWDGAWVDGAVAPMDLARIDVHILTAANADPMLTGPVASIVAQGWGGASVNLAEGEYWAVLVAWSQSGQYALSGVSASVTVSPPATGSPSDGLAPATSPACTTLGAIGMIFVKWPAVVNADPVTYEIHVSTTSGFTPDASTLLAETGATMGVAKQLPDGTLFAYGADYFFAIVAKDVDDAAAPGAQAVGQMNPAAAGDLAAGSVTAEKLEAMLVLSSQMWTALTGARAGIDTNGFHSFDSAENLIFDVPTTPNDLGEIIATLNAHMWAKSLTVIDRMALRGANNELSRGAKLILKSGTTEPQSSPTPTLGYPSKVSGPTPSGILNVPLAMAYAGTKWLAVCGFLAGSEIATYTETPTTMIHDATLVSAPPSGYEFKDIAVVGASTVAVLSVNSSAALVEVYAYTGTAMTLTTSWPVSVATSPHNCRLASDGTNIIFGEYDSASTLTFRHFNTSGVLQSTVTAALATFGAILRGFEFGSFDLGVSRYVASVSGGKAYTFGTTGTAQPNETFPLPTSDAAVRWNSTEGAFRSLYAGTVYTHSKHTWTTESAIWWLGHTWYDSNATGSVHETIVSPLRSFTMIKRATLTVTTPPLPARPSPTTTDDAVAVRVYSGRGATAPARTAMTRRATFADGITVGNLNGPFAFTGADNPPVATDFPDNQVSSVESVTGGLVLRSDGTMDAPLKIQTGATSLSFPTTAIQSVVVPFGGSMSSIPKVMITPTSASNASTTLQWYVSGVTTSQFTLNAYRSGVGTIGFAWIAVAA